MAAALLVPLTAVIAARFSKQRLEAFLCAIGCAGGVAMMFVFMHAWDNTPLFQQAALPLACAAAAVAGALAAVPLPPRPMPGGHPFVLALIATFLLMLLAAPNPLTLLLPFFVCARIFSPGPAKKP